MADKRLKRRLKQKSKAFLAAPIVATAMFLPACGGPVYRNPGPPTEPQPPEVTPQDAPETTPTDEPETPSTDGPTTTSPEALPDAPKNGGGKIEKQSDGTCLYVYPRPKEESCPPPKRCNPGPPRQPLPVKCPDGGAT